METLKMQRNALNKQIGEKRKVSSAQSVPELSEDLLTAASHLAEKRGLYRPSRKEHSTQKANGGGRSF